MVESFFDIIANSGLSSLDMAELKTLYLRYLNTDKKRCGSCYFWLKTSLCPKEHDLVSWLARGPSASEIACKKFEWTDSAKDFKEKSRLKLIEKIKAVGIEMPRELRVDNES